MRETIVKEYCDRCKKEIEKIPTYNIFDDQRLHIKFQKIKFSALPKRWRKDAEIDTHYTEEEQHFILCQKCAKEFVEWWEGGSN